MAKPSSDIEIRNYISKYAMANILQLYIKNDNEKILKPLLIKFAREKNYIGAKSDDLSKIPPFMFHEILMKAINEAKIKKTYVIDGTSYTFTE